jgi:hypothetical protein
VNGCVAAARDLTELVVRLGAAHETLVRQSRMQEADFGGRAGDAFRGHASRSADWVAEAASDLALLAAALARLGRELESVAELRAAAERLTPGQAVGARSGADERERRAQSDWRTAVAGYEQRR